MKGSGRGLWAPLAHRDYRLLATGQAISKIGDWFYAVALLVVTLELTHSSAWVAAAGVVGLLPYVVFGAIGGVIADTWPRKRVMIIADLARAAIMALLAVVVAAPGPALLVILLAGLSTTFAVAYDPCVPASVPALVTEDELSAANSIDTSIVSIALAVGPAIGGLVLVVGPPEIAFAVNAVTFLLSALMVWLIRTDLGPQERAAQEEEESSTKDAPKSTSRFARRLTEGLAVVFSSRQIVVLAGSWVAVCFLYGLEIVLLLLVATERLGTGDAGLSFLYTAFGVGGLLGAGVANRLADRARQGLILAAALAAAGFAYVGLALTTSAAAAYVLEGINGVSSVVLTVLVVTSMQRLLGTDLLGRAFGAVDALCGLSMLIGTVVAPVLVGIVGLGAALLVSGSIVVATAVVLLLQARDIDRRAVERAERLAPRVRFLAGLELFEGASRITLEGLAEQLTEEPVTESVDVIREGDEPDDVFGVVSGHLVVTVSGRGVVGELEPGDFFGEIGLLHRTPRTASVTADRPCQLVRIPGEEFLRLVSTSPIRSARLRQVIQSRLATSRPDREPNSMGAMRRGTP